MVVAVGAAPRRWAPPRAAFLRRLWKYRGLYALLLPALIYFLVCHFYPYLLMMIAFKEYSPVQGVWGSPWVGFKYFQQLFGLTDFHRILINTLLISLYKLLWGFPVPVIFALLLNEVRARIFQRAIQTVTYFPHCLS